jgi:hypothetical protein
VLRHGRSCPPTHTLMTHLTLTHGPAAHAATDHLPCAVPCGQEAGADEQPPGQQFPHHAPGAHSSVPLGDGKRRWHRAPASSAGELRTVHETAAKNGGRSPSRGRRQPGSSVLDRFFYFHYQSVGRCARPRAMRSRDGLMVWTEISERCARARARGSDARGRCARGWGNMEGFAFDKLRPLLCVAAHR